jgi:hypothetical protein
MRQAAEVGKAGPDHRYVDMVGPEQAEAVPVPVGDARCIAPPTVDGASRVARAGAVDWLDVHRGLRRVVDRISEGAITDRQGRPKKGVKWAWTLANGKTVPATVTVGGADRQWITVEVEGAIWLQWHRISGNAAAQARARELWWAGAGATGWQAWLDVWLRSAEQLLGGEAVGRVTPVGGDGWAPGERWRVTALEICSDFVGFAWCPEDAAAVVGGRKAGALEKWLKTKRYQIETLYIGRRTSSPISVALYDKSDEICRKKSAEVYQAVHLRNGWRGERIERVEFRLHGSGLEFKSAAKDASAQDGDQLFSVRDPAMIDADSLRQLWGMLATKKRIIVIGSATRRERCVTDPRWELVQSAGDLPEVKWVQLREPQADAYAIRLRGAIKAALSGALRVATLIGAGKEEDPVTVTGQVLSEASPELLARCFERAAEYRDEQESQLGEEIAQARAAWAKRDRRRPSDAVIARALAEVADLEVRRAERAEIVRRRKTVRSYEEQARDRAAGQDAAELIGAAARLLKPVSFELFDNVEAALVRIQRVEGWDGAVEFLDQVRDLMRAVDWPDLGVAAKRWELDSGLSTGGHGSGDG